LIENEEPFQKDMILKFDVEGAEWDNLSECSIELLSRFRMIVGEFHGLAQSGDPKAHATIRRVLEKLTSNHTVVHIHANNHHGLATIENVAVPDLLEITFCRNDDKQFVDYNGPLPCELDFRNVQEYPDVILRV
jgi:hypothetical protein